jgi:choline-glycine betaine transporter
MLNAVLLLAQRDTSDTQTCLEVAAWPFGILLLYLIVRDGVTRGMLAAWKKRDEERLKQAVKAEQAAQAAAAAKKASRGS